MAVFGYLVYCVLTFWVTMVSIVVVVNPFGGVGEPAEKWFMLIIMGLFWYGTYTWFPFKVSLQ